MSILIQVWTYFGVKFIGDEEMMALLFASRVILEKTKWEDVPDTLKQPVYEELLLVGMEFLAGDYEPIGEAQDD